MPATRFLAAAALLAALLMPAGEAFAQSTTQIPVRTEIVIPGSTIEQAADGFVRGAVANLSNYISVIYNFLISIVGTVAAVYIMVGGFQYLIARGDAGAITKAKERITNALIGLGLALGSFVILNTVNPALLELRVPELRQIKTELAFIPFCDELKKELNIATDPTLAPTTENASGCRTCGCPAYYKRAQNDRDGNPITEKDENGNDVPVSARLWCLMRDKDPGTPQYINGCGQVSYRAETVTGTDGLTVPRACVPGVNFTSAELEAQFVKDGKVANDYKLAQCLACEEIHNSIAVNGLGYRDPSDLCSKWMNVANNNSIGDNRFSILTKADTNYAIDGQHPRYMYYCGWSSTKNICVTSRLNCDAVKSCSDYDDQNLKWCPSQIGAGATCRDEDLNSFTGGSYGKHLGPICASNPCNASGSCNTGIISRIGQAVGSDGVSVALRGATLGLIDSNSCD